MVGLGRRGIFYLQSFVCNCERRFEGSLHTKLFKKSDCLKNEKVKSQGKTEKTKREKLNQAIKTAV